MAVVMNLNFICGSIDYLAAVCMNNTQVRIELPLNVLIWNYNFAHKKQEHRSLLKIGDHEIAPLAIN